MVEIKKEELIELKKIFEEQDDSLSDYKLLIKCIDAEVLIHADELNWQGDSWYLFKNNEGTMYGFLTFGWGSCSGCDALLGCDSFDRVMSLLHTLKESIIWKTKEDMLEYFKTKDWSLDHYGEVDEFKDFKYKVITMLGGF